MGNRQLFGFILKKWSGGPFFHELENQRASYGQGDHFFTSQKIKGGVMVRGYKQFGELFVPELENAKAR